jgi:hypothetical protein
MYKQAFLVAFFLLAGCGSTSPGTSIAKACADLAAARCNKRSVCSGAIDITRVYGSMDVCLARETLSCTIGLNAPSTGNTPDLVEKCVAAFPNFTCADFFNNNPPADCIVSGPKAANAACAFGGQCASSYCNNNKTSNCGSCGAAPAVSSSCLHSNCARQQICVARIETCVTPAALNGACDNNAQPCGPDLACVGNTGGAMGTCKTPLAASAACSQMLGLCDGTTGYACQGATGSRTCTAISYGGDGADCGSLANGVFAGCASGGACYTATGLAMAGEAGKCKAAAADNAACDIALGPPCLAPSRCIVGDGGTAGVCTVPSGSTCG